MNTTDGVYFKMSNNDITVIVLKSDNSTISINEAIKTAKEMLSLAAN